MKIILVLLDGLGDRAYPQLDQRTPLQAADTPNLDRLAALGSNGLFHASAPGQCLPSEIAHTLMFGYALDDFPGRGLLEAIGDGVPHRKDDVLCLAHLCQIDWHAGTAVLKKGRDEIAGTREAIGRVYRLIERYQKDGMGIRLVQTHRNDAILVLSGPVSDRISDSDPIRTGRPVARIAPFAGENAELTARVLNAYLQHCHDVLADPVKNPYRDKVRANFLVTHRCGRHRPQIDFQTRWGLKGALIASQAVYAGLARVLGLDFVPAQDTGSPGGDLRRRIAQALADTAHDFIHVHTKAADQAAHHGDPEHKRDVIALLDGGLEDLLKTVPDRDDILLAVTADHSTPSQSALVHSGEPVPVMMCGPRVRRDNVRQFDEIAAAGGCLGTLRGAEVMHMLLNYADRSNFFSHRLGTGQRCYVPSDYETFKMR